MFLGYSTRHGQALLDRRLYLPKEWAEDRERCAAAGVPKSIRFATKIVLAHRMIAAALGAGVPARWIAADAVYGSDYTFRQEIEDCGLGYVVGVRTEAVWAGLRQVRVKPLLAEVPDDGWQRLRCGNGSKGPRLYDWALIPINAPEPEVYRRWLLVRRSTTDPNEVACFLCGGKPTATLRDLVRVAGQRWTIEECFELAKRDCGLDEYEVRSWTGWHRHVTLSLFALAVLAVIRSRIRPRARTPKRRKKGALTEPKV